MSEIEEAPPQVVVPARPASEHGRSRYYVFAWVIDISSAKRTVMGFFELEEPLERKNLKTFLIDQARKEGAVAADDADVCTLTFYELGKVPRPVPDERPLLSWYVSVDFVCHDVKFGGSYQGNFGWPEEPTGRVLDEMCLLLMGDMLAIRGSGPDNAPYSDILSCKVEPSCIPPDMYR